ncbi:hypothetical protein AgCh_005477 [Apium graveolens]
MHACTARHLLLVEKDSSQQIFPAKMDKVVSFNMNQEDSTNGNKNMVDRNVHNQDEYSVNIVDAAKENDTSQKEKTQDHRGSGIDVSLSRKRIHESMSSNRIDQSTSQAVLVPNAKQILPEEAMERMVTGKLSLSSSPNRVWKGKKIRVYYMYAHVYAPNSSGPMYMFVNKQYKE